MIVDDPEHITKASLDPESSVEEPTNNADNHEQALSRVESSLAGYAVQDSERRVEQSAENTHTVDELLWILERGDSGCQLTSHDAHKLLDAGNGELVVRNLDKFTGLDTSVAHKLIDAGSGWLVVRNLDKFTGLDTNVAHKLIDAGYELQVLQCAHVFGESTSEIVLGCIDKIKLDADVADAVLEHL